MTGGSGETKGGGGADDAPSGAAGKPSIRISLGGAAAGGTGGAPPSAAEEAPAAASAAATSNKPKLKIRAPTPSVAASSGAASTGPSPKAAALGIPSPRPPSASGPRPERYVGSSSSNKKKPDDDDDDDSDLLVTPGSGAAQHLRLLHQRTELSLAYRDGCWAYGGETTLWLVDEGSYGGQDGVAAASGGAAGAGKSATTAGAAASSTPGSTAMPDTPGTMATPRGLPTTIPQRKRELALHLRGGCHVESVCVESCIVTASIVEETKKADVEDAAAVDGATEAVPQTPAVKEGNKADEADIKMENDGEQKQEGGTPATPAAPTTPATPAAINTPAAAESASKSLNVNATASLQPVPSVFIHFDPLQRVLRKPATTYTADEFEAEMIDAEEAGTSGDFLGTGIRRGRCHADTQSTRGAEGMMDALRAASVASRMGELRILVGDVTSAAAAGDSGKTADGKASAEDEQNQQHVPVAVGVAAQRSASDVWAASLNRLSVLRGPAAPKSMPGRIVRRLRTRLADRCEKRREGRIKLVSDRLAQASVGSSGDRVLSPSNQSIPDTDGPSSLEVTDANYYVPAALKVTVRFVMASIPAGLNHHAGGIHFSAPTPDHFSSSSNIVSPHVYTTAGIHGDHEGPRSWLPTLDSASSKHRASHELTVKMTAGEEEGLWSAGFGEDFGAAEGVGHCAFPPPAQPNQSDIVAARSPVVDGNSSGIDVANGDRQLSIGQRVGDALVKALGTRHVAFCTDFFDGTLTRSMAFPDVHVIPIDNEGLQAQRLVTNVWTTASWSPVPSRSLAFAAGPFRALYDPEYYSQDDDEDDEDDEEENEAEKRRRVAASRRSGDDRADDEEGLRSRRRSAPPTVEELAMGRAEGVRQLYFTIKAERVETYANAPDIAGLSELFEECLGPDSELVARNPGGLLSAYAIYHFHQQRRSRMPSHTPTRPTTLQQRLDIEAAIIRSTSGVPNRALSITRDILALPSYRSSSHTQIWIPQAADGGSTSGGLKDCPEAGGCNPFLGGAIFDASLLPPSGHRLPYHSGGRTLQFAQARAAIRGWITAALPLGSQDDIGQSYLHCIAESVLMSLYEKGHGAWGEGGAKGSYFFSSRYAIKSGLNSSCLDFLPLPNVEEEDVDSGILGAGGIAAVPVEEKGADLWRSAANGTESHTSALDEHAIRHLLMRDVLDYYERQDKNVPLPSNNWKGSHLSATFLSSNSTSSSAVGCGAVELMHPIGGIVYRNMKAEVLRRVVEGRAGLVNLVRVVRAAFAAALMEDAGETKLILPKEDDKKRKKRKRAVGSAVAAGGSPEAVSIEAASHAMDVNLPPYATCVDELIKKGGLTHMTFARALRILSGPIREPYLRGSLVDVDRDVSNKFRQTTRQLVEPENFPNSFVRGASSLFLRVGVHVEAVGADIPGGAASPAGKGTHLHVFAEPVVPQGGLNFGGPITLRVIENEGQCREFVKAVPGDGSRVQWGPLFLHAKPVTSQKQQTAASGSIETASTGAKSSGPGDSSAGSINGASSINSIFTQDTMLHGMGYQALELIRLTNRTPLLWCTVDPHCMYDGRVAIFQPDSCLAEKLFHAGEALSQVDAIRCLAERPHRIQGQSKVKTIFDVDVAELPVRVLGDCLRGAATLQRDLPHNPAIRIQAALAIAQWQNNKAPDSSSVVGSDSWLGLDLLIQYFKERWFSGDTVMPVHYTRTVCKRPKPKNRGAEEAGDDFLTALGQYVYLDAIPEASERASLIETADAVHTEEDEEHRVRSAVITAISSIRAKDGLTPPAVIRFLETVLKSGDGALGHVVPPGEEDLIRKKRLRRSVDQEEKGEDDVGDISGDAAEDIMDTSFVSVSALADSLLALCHVNIRPARFDDPTIGVAQIQADPTKHPILPLMALCHRWLEWDLYREGVRLEAETETMTGVGGGCYSTVSACAITALSSLALLRQSTTDGPQGQVPTAEEIQNHGDSAPKRKTDEEHHTKSEIAATAKYYADIFDSRPARADTTRAAAAQAVACICCAADRLNDPNAESLGLLTALEFLLDRIQDPTTSLGLRQTLSALMFDACTGKVCSMQRAAVIGSTNDLCTSAARFTSGPLGASHGGDNGSAFLLSVSEDTYPAANAVNDGARQGLRFLNRVGKDSTFSDRSVVRVAKFATKLWRTMNGETSPSSNELSNVGVCSQDSHLRCNLLALWQWVWPKSCIALLRVQSWSTLVGTERYIELGCDEVMKYSPEEKEGSLEEEDAFKPMKSIVDSEIDRQRWRGEMALRAYDFNKKEKEAAPAVVEGINSTSQDIGKPLPLIEKDQAWKSGGWIASAAQQRRSKGLDGGSAVTKINLRVKASGGD